MEDENTKEIFFENPKQSLIKRKVCFLRNEPACIRDLKKF
jgi:hypothetical protein